MAEVVEARILIETPMVELALEKITDTELAEMESHVVTMEGMGSTKGAVHGGGPAVHLVLAAGTKNRVLSGFMSIAKSILRRDQLHLLGISYRGPCKPAHAFTGIFQSPQIAQPGPREFGHAAAQ